MSPRLLHPRDFDDSHKAFVADFRRAMAALSQVSNTIAGCKDVDGRTLAATDQHARKLGVARGPDLEGLHDRDMPCEDVVRHAQGFEVVEQALMRAAGRKPAQAMFSILDYATGLAGMFGEKRALIHPASGDVLGTTYFSREVDIARVMALLPNHFRELGMGCTIERAEACPTPDGGTLPEPEHEVAFLFSVGGAGEVAAFMARHRPHAGLDTPDAVYRCIGRIGERMGAEGSGGATLRELLVTQGMHRRAPPSLFRKLVGVYPLHDGVPSGLVH